MIDGIDGGDDRWSYCFISDRPDPVDYTSDKNRPNDCWQERQTQFYERKVDCITRGMLELGMAYGSGMSGDLAGAYEHAAEAGAALAESIISDFSHAWESIRSFSDSEKDRFR